ncbi:MULTISPECIES: hypothetical protein [unclassified Sinorhizobium]|uniref:hypothetical protein n=1 Tax=unclassified Sinorhizobium TaxID=2613772 RepID=UPI00352384E5
MEQQQIPVPQQTPTQTEPLSPQVHAPEVKPEAPKPAESARAAVEAAAKRAAEAQASKDQPKTEPKQEAKPEAKEAPKVEARERSEDGKFKSTQVAETPVKASDATENKAGGVQSEGRATRYEAPSRFNDQGKGEWEGTPESVKAEVHRALKENEDGIKKYKEASERYERIREYDELARKNGREGIHESLKQIQEIENTFARNPIEGLKKVADHFNLNLQAVASHILGQNPNQQVAEAHQTINELRAEIKRMKDEQAAPQIVNDFFTQNEEAGKYTQSIATALKLGIVQNLEDAWEYAKMFGKPDDESGSTASEATGRQAITPPQSADAQTVAPSAPNPAGQKSVTGAPTSTSETQRKSEPSKSPLDAVRKAAARLG